MNVLNIIVLCLCVVLLFLAINENIKNIKYKNKVKKTVHSLNIYYRDVFRARDDMWDYNEYYEGNRYNKMISEFISLQSLLNGSNIADEAITKRIKRALHDAETLLYTYKSQIDEFINKK